MSPILDGRKLSLERVRTLLKVTTSMGQSSDLGSGLPSSGAWAVDHDTTRPQTSEAGLHVFTCSGLKEPLTTHWSSMETDLLSLLSRGLSRFRHPSPQLTHAQLCTGSQLLFHWIQFQKDIMGTSIHRGRHHSIEWLETEWPSNPTSSQCGHPSQSPWPQSLHSGMSLLSRVPTPLWYLAAVFKRECNDHLLVLVCL